jgi:hypothetical protein
MSDYLPLCAFRQESLPATCGSCAWWQTAGSQRLASQAATARRREWMTALEDVWGPTGLLQQSNGSIVRPAGGCAAPTEAAADSAPGDPAVADATSAAAPRIIGSINFAPATAVPRLRDLPFGPFPAAAALLFCLMVEEGQPRSQSKRLLHKALAQLKSRGMQEAYAIAVSSGALEDADACRFFLVDFLEANGFEQVTSNGRLVLMRADLRGLLSLVDQVETAVRRLLRNEPTPSPAAWTRPGG